MPRSWIPWASGTRWWYTAGTRWTRYLLRLAPTTVCELRDGFYRTSRITPEQFGLARGAKEELQGGTPEENARTTRGILSGEIRDARRTSVLMNAGCGLYAGNAAASIEEGIKIAADMIDSGKALAVLDAYIEASNRAV